MSVSRAELVTRARELAPSLAERAVKTEELRRIPEETFQAFKDAGLLRALVPKAYGGFELELRTVIETSREIGQACGSASWCLAICSLHNWMVASFPEAAQREVFGPSPDAVVCGVFMPGGTATPVDGGYRLSGQWNFASGCDHASHAVLAGVIQPADGGAPTGLANLLVRRAEFAIDDNWYVAGLVGTGSKRVIVEDVFVPTHFTVAATKGAADGSRGAARLGARGLPFNSVATLGLAGVTLGVARGAIAAFQDRLATKLRTSSLRGADGQVGAQLRLAESATEVDGAELLTLRDCDEMERTAAAGGPPTAEQRGRYRRDAAHVFQVCARAVARLMPAGGASSVFREAAQQRAMRDTQVMSAHVVADWDMARETYARALLDLPIEDPVF